MEDDLMRFEPPKKVEFRIRAYYYTPMLKPLGVNVPGSPTSTMPGTAPLFCETTSENPLTRLITEITEETLKPLTVPALRDLINTICAISEDNVSKLGKKTILIQRILASKHKDAAVQHFLAGMEALDPQKQERVILKLFNSLRGGLRPAGVEILRDLHLPHSVPALSEDQLPEGAHHVGECPEPDQPCLLCRVFGSMKQESLFKNYTPPLVNDPDHKLNPPQELNHVFIRIHSRNVHRPNGNTLNFNQQYFAGTFVTYLNSGLRLLNNMFDVGYS